MNSVAAGDGKGRQGYVCLQPFSKQKLKTNGWPKLGSTLYEIME